MHNPNILSIQSCNINVYIKHTIIKEFLVVNPSSAEISGGECYGEEEGGGHNPRFYCQLTGFPATLAALSGIALCHDSLTSSQWRDRDLLINAECGAGASKGEKLLQEKYDNDSMGWQEVVEEEERSFGR